MVQYLIPCCVCKVGALCVFLASDDAAYITGTVQATHPQHVRAFVVMPTTSCLCDTGSTAGDGRWGGPWGWPLVKVAVDMTLAAADGV